MSPDNPYYLFFAAIDAALILPLYLCWRSHLGAWRKISANWRYGLIITAAALLAIATGAWLLASTFTYTSWLASADPSQPKPYFLIYWGLGIVTYGFTLSIAQALNVLTRAHPAVVQDMGANALSTHPPGSRFQFLHDLDRL